MAAATVGVALDDVGTHNCAGSRTRTHSRSPIFSGDTGAGEEADASSEEHENVATGVFEWCFVTTEQLHCRRPGASETGVELSSFDTVTGAEGVS